MKRATAIFTILLLLGGIHAGVAQGFVNLNFESANLSGYPAGDMAVPISAAFPGWSAFSINTRTVTNTATTVWYDALSEGGAAISINDTNTGFGFVPLQGKYSAMLFGGGGYTVGISQTGVVPGGTESLEVQVSTSIFGGPFTPVIVTLGGQTISMAPLQTFPNYTLYGGDVSAFAGQIEALSITEPPPVGTPPSVVELDNIMFSSNPVAEPGTCGLILCGAVLFGLRRWRKALA
jgi:hypothetical protein